MKRGCFILCAFLALAVATNLLATSILAQENQEGFAPPEIKDLIETYLKNFALRDINGMMSAISQNFSGKNQNGPMDFQKFKSALEKQVSTSSKTYINFSIDAIKIVKSNVKENAAEVLVANAWSGYNLDTSEEDKGKTVRWFYLRKENGLWKIAGMKFMSPSK